MDGIQPSLPSLFTSLLFCSFPRVEDKQRVASLTCIANFLPEVTIGAHDNDASYYAYQSVCMGQDGGRVRRGGHVTMLGLLVLSRNVLDLLRFE